MKTSFKRFLGLSIGVAAMAATTTLFQNCSKTPLITSVEPSIYQAPLTELKTSICPDVRVTKPGATKFVFMVDMSVSNIGDWDREVVGGLTYSYFNRSKQTDEAGSRFAAIKYFLENCGQQSGAQFQVIGFSNSAGIVTGSGSGASWNCSSLGFVTASQASATVDTLKTFQDSEAPWYYRWAKPNYYKTSTPPPILGTTSYTSALDCAKSLISNDLSSPGSNITEFYNLFLISDGSPFDKRGQGCEVNPTAPQADKNRCYSETAIEATSFMRQAAIAKGVDLRIFGIFYGGATTVPVVLDAVAKDGGTSGPIALNSFEGNQGAFCDLVIAQIGVEYKPDIMASINLTSIRKNNLLVADSDMDGLIDEEEEKNGFDPANPRSKVEGVLDGICMKLGGFADCENRKSLISPACDPFLMNGFGLSDCDFKILNLHKVGNLLRDQDRDGLPDDQEQTFGTQISNPRSSGASGVLDGLCFQLGSIKTCIEKRSELSCSEVITDGYTDCDKQLMTKFNIGLGALWGIDTDKDSVPDYVEILKGTDPAVADSNFDPDGDGLVNSVEISQGTDPLTKDSNLPAYVLNNSSAKYEKTENSCNGPAWNIKATRLQVVATERVPVSDYIIPGWVHSANQNVLLHYYRKTPQNSTSPISEFYGTFYKVNYTSVDGQEVLSSVKTSEVSKNISIFGKVAQ